MSSRILEATNRYDSIPKPVSALQGAGSVTGTLPFKILITALALTVLEGAVRKWVIGSGFSVESYIAYFSKDIVFALLVFIPARRVTSPPMETFRRCLVPGSFLVICGALMSATQEVNLGGTVLTLRALLFLPVIAFVAIPCLNGISLRSVAWTIGLLTIVNFSLGVIQNNLSPGHLLNRYASDALHIVTTQTGVRAAGTFSYISGMSVMSLVGVWAGMVCMSLAHNVRQQMFGWSVIASGFGCALASVSRGPVFTGAVIALCWLLASHKWAANKSGSVTAGILVLGLVMVFGLRSTFLNLGDGLLLRANTAGDSTQERTVGSYADALMAINMAPFGNGLGTEQIGGSYYRRGEMSFTTFETQFARLVLETSLLGLVGFVVVCAGAILALQVAKQYTNENGKNAAVLATQLFMVAMFGTNVVFNHVASAFVWIIFAAVMAALPNRDALNSEELIRRPI